MRRASLLIARTPLALPNASFSIRLPAARAMPCKCKFSATSFSTPRQSVSGVWDFTPTRPAGQLAGHTMKADYGSRASTPTGLIAQSVTTFLILPPPKLMGLFQGIGGFPMCSTLPTRTQFFGLNPTNLALLAVLKQANG